MHFAVDVVAPLYVALVLALVVAPLHRSLQARGRAAVNAVTGVGVTLVLWLLGVDFPVLWGIVTFFLSFIPYIGMFLASVPSVLLALLEYGPGRAFAVIIALTVVNALAENLLQPA